MKLTELRAKVRALTGIPLPDLLPDSDIDAFLNEAYREVCRLRAWPFLTTAVDLPVTAGTTTVVLPPAVRDVLGCSLRYETGDSWVLESRTLAGLAEDGWTPNRRPGTSRTYCADEVAHTLTLDPPPVRPATLTVRHTISAAPLTSDNDEPLFRAEYHDALAYAAAALVLSREADGSGRAGSYQTRFDVLCTELERDYRMRTDRSVLHIGVTHPRRRRSFGGR